MWINTCVNGWLIAHLVPGTGIVLEIDDCLGLMIADFFEIEAWSREYILEISDRSFWYLTSVKARW